MIENGFYTLESDGRHFTLRVRTQPAEATFAPGKRILGLMRGKDNENSYQPFAFVTGESVYVWGRHQSNKLLVRLAYLLRRASLRIQAERCCYGSDPDWDGTASFEDHKRSYKASLSKRCLVCNRRLTTPESLKRGIGPECAKKVAA